MANAVKKGTSLLLLSFFLLQCLTNDPATSGSVALAATISEGYGPWCVARSGATPEALQANIQKVCLGGIADCREIQKGGKCYLPDDIVKHASYAMNAAYYELGQENKNCYFNGTGLVVYNDDPSYGDCVYIS